jgi:uncharacterized membrane protein YcaP (DUF421 family)
MSGGAQMDGKDYAFDLHRLFLGEHPPTYIFEILLRVFLVYGVTLLFLRWAGKRTLAELTFFDFAIIIALGSAVGDGMIFDDVPLVHSFVVVAAVMLLERLVAMLTEKNKSLEAIIEGVATLVVEDGVIVTKNLHQETISLDELFERLRQHGIHQLGQISVAYLETSGKVSVITANQPRPGLSVLPEGKRLCDEVTQQDKCCCSVCGFLTDSSANQTNSCPHCQEECQWKPATLPQPDKNTTEID